MNLCLYSFNLTLTSDMNVDTFFFGNYLKNKQYNKNNKQTDLIDELYFWTLLLWLILWRSAKIAALKGVSPLLQLAELGMLIGYSCLPGEQDREGQKEVDEKKGLWLQRQESREGWWELTQLPLNNWAWIDAQAHRETAADAWKLVLS